MNSSELSQRQAAALYEALFPHLNYLRRLQNRIEALRFPADDPLRLAVDHAYESTWRLQQEAHRLAVRMGCR